MPAGNAEQSQNLWEEFAVENAEHYILTERGSYRSDVDRQYFFASGQATVTEILARVESALPNDQRALEIGCGVGRITIPMSRRFHEVVGVDVSPTMLAKLGQNCKEQGVHNVEGFLPDGPWDQEQSCSLIYSWIVLQHIADFGLIAEYLRRASFALVRGGVAYLQFDTRPASWSYRLRNALPNFCLPRRWRSGIRRIRRSPEVLREEFAKNRLTILAEYDPDSELHTVVAKRVD